MRQYLLIGALCCTAFSARAANRQAVSTGGDARTIRLLTLPEKTPKDSP